MAYLFYPRYPNTGDVLVITGYQSNSYMRARYHTDYSPKQKEKEPKELTFIKNLHRLYKPAFRLWKSPNLFILGSTHKESTIILEKMRQKKLEFKAYSLNNFNFSIAIDATERRIIKNHKWGRFSKEEKEKIGYPY